MPRPLPKKEDYYPCFQGLNYVFDNIEPFSTRLNAIITCSEGHEYRHNIGKVKRKEVDAYICPHCEKIKRDNEKRLSYEKLVTLIDSNKFSVINPKDYYRVWEDKIELRCNVCHGEKTVCSINYSLKVNNLDKLKCEICTENEERLTKGLIDQDEFQKQVSGIVFPERKFEMLPEADITNLSEHYIQIYKNQKKWRLVYFENRNIKCKIMCVECGYIKETLFHNNFCQKGFGCPQCQFDKQKRNIYEEMKSYCTNNYVYPTNLQFYKDVHTDIEFKCNKCGGLFNKKWKEKSYGFDCPTCSNCSSKTEQAFADFIRSIYPKEIKRNDRTEIKPYELDVYLPQDKIAFEFCGNIWHCTKYSKDNNRHRDKHEMCEKASIRLITIFEDEWNNNKDICVSRINNLLGQITKKIFARKCEVKPIANKIALDFCDQNHIQGKGQAYESFGLFFEDSLVSVMTFSKPSVAKHAVGYDWELNRFCSVKDVVVVGGANKLLNQFRKQHVGEKLITFCDLRWGTGNVYEKLSFNYVATTRPNYYYIGSYTKWERKHRFNFTKQKLIKLFGGEVTSTEQEIAEANELYRIFDCGHKKYEMIC